MSYIVILSLEHRTMFLSFASGNRNLSLSAVDQGIVGAGELKHGTNGTGREAGMDRIVAQRS